MEQRVTKKMTFRNVQQWLLVIGCSLLLLSVGTLTLLVTTILISNSIRAWL